MTALVFVTVATVAADSKQKAFENDWLGRRVVVTRPLYSLVYKEQSLRGAVEARRDGLTVVTPFDGVYFQFDGRRHVDDVTERDVVKIAGAVKLAYVRSKIFDEGANQVIDPVMLARYDPGAALVVVGAHVNRETVRLDLSLPTDGDRELATSLTVQWPAPFSKSFAERVDVEGLIHQFLASPE